MRYIQTIRIRGFQSHADTTIHLHPGLNAITGPSDSGKSAILRALAWWAWGETPTGDWIRKGHTLASVEVTLSDGTVITRERRSGRNRYIIRLPGADPMELVDFGRQVPQEVLRAHGMIPVAFDPDRPSILNWASQLEPPFFLTEPGPMRARIIGRLAGVHVIDAAIKAANRDLVNIARETKAQEEEVERIAAQLEAFADLDDQEQRVARAEAIVSRLDGLLRRLDQLTILRERLAATDTDLTVVRVMLTNLAGVDKADQHLARAVEAHARYQRVAGAGVRLTTTEAELSQLRAAVDQLRQVDGAGDLISRASHVHRSYASLSGIQRRLQEAALAQEQEAATLERLAGVDGAADTLARAQAAAMRHRELERLARLSAEVAVEMDNLHQYLARTQGLLRVHEGLRKAAEVSVTLDRLLTARQALQTVTSQLSAVQEIITRSRGVDGAEERLATVARVTGRLASLQVCQERLAEVNGAMERGRQFLADLDRQIQTVAGEYAQALQAAGVCPTCLQVIDQTTAAQIAATIMREEESRHVHAV